MPLEACWANGNDDALQGQKVAIMPGERSGGQVLGILVHRPALSRLTR